MKTILSAAALLTATVTCAQAQDAATPWSLRLGIANLGFDESADISLNGARVRGASFETDDDTTLTVSLGYRFADRFSAEATVGLPPTAQLNGTGPLQGMELVTKEQGKPLNGLGSRWEIGGAQAWAGYTASLSLPVKTLQDTDQGRVELHRKPLGVVGSITPWNFPVMIAVWHILPALRTGNTVVVKPSPFTPLATIRLVEIMQSVLPENIVQVVTGDDKDVNLGAAMSAHEGIRKIVFTGSCATGRRVMQTAADTMKRLTLELGGNDAGIVLPDADPAAIVEGLFWGAFINNGQTCAAMKRLYVHASIYDAVCEHLVAFAKTIPVGDGQDEGSILGPIQNQMQFDKVSRLVEAAKTKGRVLLGGQAGEGLFFPPTIIADLDASDPLVSEEQFGPALPVIRYTDIDEAITAANASENGLGGSIWTSDIAKGRALANRLECGSVWINKHGAIQPNAP
ncbi:MAG: aldehyde dehydrogenase family protein, partial [Pseudomonadota bacterium]|nr:aldehyde dehydrogenase family protein [Pseudomonadota bacterium]